MIELFLGALVLAAFAYTVPKALVDAYATAKAASAGRWDVVERGRARPSLGERLGTAWAARRQARHEQAGGGGDYRPGAGAYAADLYHGFWEDRLDRRAKKRAARPEWEYDPDRPSLAERIDAAVLARVQRYRAAMRGDKSIAARPEEQAGASAPVVHEPGTWTVGDDGQPVPLAAAGNAAEQTDNTNRQEEAGVHSCYDCSANPSESCPNNRTDEERFGDEQRRARVFGHVDELLDNGGTTLTGSTQAAAVAAEVNTNEDARCMFAAMRKAAAELAEAAAMAELARQKLAALAQSGADGLTAKAFDAGAQSAAASAADAVSLGTLANWSEAADHAGAAATAGLASLDKYRDAEDVVAANAVDPTTLASTSS